MGMKVTRAKLSTREHDRVFAMCEALGKDAYIEGPAVAWLWKVHRSARRLVEYTGRVISRVDRRWHA